MWWVIPSETDDVVIKWTVIVKNNIINDVLLETWATLQNYTVRSQYIWKLKINWDLINNWIIKSVTSGDTTYKDQLTLEVNWNIENNWEIIPTRTYLYWSLDNINWDIPSSLYLKWDKIEDYTDYILSITWEAEISIDNSTQYLLPNHIKTDPNLYWKVKWDWILFDSERSELKCINVPWCIQNWIEPISVPIKLKQWVKSPLLEKQGINPWEQIWKYQSWSGIILSADIQTGALLNIEVYKNGTLTPVFSDTSSWEIVVPYQGSWAYYWKARTMGQYWQVSERVDYETDNMFEADYILYEWFEPYPYGYKFYNNWPANWLLTGWVSQINWITRKREKIPWNKWDIFFNAFDLSTFQNNQNKIFDAFENVWLNKDDVFQWWNCNGMSVSATMQYKYPVFLQAYYFWFSEQIWTGKIWNKIQEPDLLNQNNQIWWNEYNSVTETLFSLQLSWYSIHQWSALQSWEDTSNNILNKIKDNPNDTYILTFAWIDFWNKPVSHTVVVYKLEWNRIYFWDSNFQYPFRLQSDGSKPKWYNQYIEVNIDWTWEAKSYNRKSFNEMSLVNIDDIYNKWNKSAPIWFNMYDILYTLNWKSDIIVTDSLWRISWFSWWTVLEDIPWVDVIIPANATLTWTIENTWKQIYLPQKKDLIVKVIAKDTENYDLMIAWWDYYTKLEWIETNSWQIDTFNITREKIEIDFDNEKTWNYDLLVDDFQNNWTWTVYIWNIKTNQTKEQYTISWTWVLDNNNNAVIYEIDTNDDWNYDELINLPPIYQDITAPTTTHTFSWTTNSTGSYIETVKIELNSIDNDWWIWVDSIYYSLDSTWSIYQKYTNPIIVNEIWNHILNYYSIDKFWNTETLKTVNFQIIKKQQDTNTWKISWYMYFDKNKNNKKDKKEKWLRRFKIYLDLNNDWKHQKKTEPYTRTNKKWYYEFNNLSKWKYIVRLWKREYNLLKRFKKILTLTPKEWYHTLNLDIWQELNQINYSISLRKVRKKSLLWKNNLFC